MNRFTIVGLLSLSVAFASAQVAHTNLTTGTQNADTSSSAVASANNSTSPSAAAAVPQNPAVTEMFRQRWKTDEEVYKKAGLSEEKIEKLRTFDENLWKSRAAGEKLDYRKIVKERNDLLTPEEQKKLQTIRRESMKNQLRSEDATTTTPQ